MHISPFNFYFNTRVAFGAGSRHQLVEILRKHGWKQVGIVVDKNVLAVSPVREMMESIRAACDQTVVAECGISEPMYDSLEEVRPAFMDKNLQAVVGIGGGSALDMAKAMAVLANNRQPAIHYRGFDRMTEPVLPIIAVPTTAGTGSEITPNASFIDAREKRKMGINGEAIRPRYALLDPELTVSCPRLPTVSAAVDSIVHSVEAYVAKKTSAMARLFSMEGFGRVFNHLSKVIEQPENLDGRAQVQYGAFLSGVALMNSGTGPAAAMSYPLGVHFKVPHGLGGALFLPYVIEHNLQRGYFDYADFYEVMTGVDLNLSREQKAWAFHQKLVERWKELRVPANLNETAFATDFIDRFVAETLQLQAALDQNPAPFGEQDIRSLVNALSR